MIRGWTEQVLARDGRCILHDARGELLGSLPATKVLLVAAHDARGWMWDIGRDVTNVHGARELAAKLVPQEGTHETMWSDGAHPQHRVFPYLLRNMAIDRPDQVWCADITYIPMRRGFLYLIAIMDRHSRRVLSIGFAHAIRSGLPWRLSNTTEADFCIEALEALSRFGRPGIFNTDLGSQFTSPRFTEVLSGAGVRISMDGRDRWMDNVFIERLWRSLKYECTFLNAFETGSEARTGIGRWIPYYNRTRPHSALGGIDIAA